MAQQLWILRYKLYVLSINYLSTSGLVVAAPLTTTSRIALFMLAASLAPAPARQDKTGSDSPPTSSLTFSQR